MSLQRKIGLVVLTAGLGACGGAAVQSVEPVEPAPSRQVELAAPQPREMEVEGILGSLDPSDCRDALAPRMRDFLGCFAARTGDVEVLGGQVELSFRVARDGSVRHVFPSDSTIGDRQTERCVLEIAETVRFPRPRGGEAEFRFPLDFDPSEDIRPAIRWDEARVTRVVARNLADVSETCGPSTGLRITAYVGPGGQVLSAGGAVADPAQQEQLDCVTEQVGRWSMPNPGSYPAKVTFSL